MRSRGNNTKDAAWAYGPSPCEVGGGGASRLSFLSKVKGCGPWPMATDLARQGRPGLSAGPFDDALFAVHGREIRYPHVVGILPTPLDATRFTGRQS